MKFPEIDSVNLMLKARMSPWRLRVKFRGVAGAPCPVLLRSTLGKRQERSISGLTHFDSEKILWVGTKLVQMPADTSIDMALRDLGDVALRRAAAKQKATLLGTTTWGDLRAMWAREISPGGRKEKDNELLSFTSKRSIGGLFDDESEVTTSQLEMIALCTKDSIMANHAVGAELERYEYHSNPFHRRITQLKFIRKMGFTASTKELIETLDNLKQPIKKKRTRFIPADDDLERWLLDIYEIQPWLGWMFAMCATYGLRPHELWHVTRLPGSLKERSLIQISEPALNPSERKTKTDMRYARAWPEHWLDLFKLTDEVRSAQYQEIIRSKRPDWVSGKQNQKLGAYVCQLMRDHYKKAPMPWRLKGFSLAGTQGMSAPYDLRHAWAHRVNRDCPEWPITLRAKFMGHSEEKYKHYYLAHEQADNKLAAVEAEMNMAAQLTSLRKEAQKREAEFEELAARATRG